MCASQYFILPRLVPSRQTSSSAETKAIKFLALLKNSLFIPTHLRGFSEWEPNKRRALSLDQLGAKKSDFGCCVNFSRTAKRGELNIAQSDKRLGSPQFSGNVGPTS
ncbi:hypothetical protein CEXT_555131 [Caerostris extrusa]|uniref:Uncharacterized protein n=1 Tax=Caerostris extrusa TaxID=172846 RepID=A0AAV4Y1K7_CAEEX|nr:hypothetical protein CEXT_555131 [Caerostris extrusa]